MVGRNPKVSIVIPVYKPNEKIFSKVKEMIKKQTIGAELIEIWNNPEAVSMNKGIKKAKGEIIILLAQDCVPIGKDWIKKLIKPLEKKDTFVSVSDLALPESFWKEYPFLTRILTINEIGVARPEMDARACAYRKKDLMKLGGMNEDPKTIAIDADLLMKSKKFGGIAHPNCVVEHLHVLTNESKIKMVYNYSEANGKLTRLYGQRIHAFWKRVLRGIPVIGLLPIFYVFPYKKSKYWKYFPAYFFLAFFQHSIAVYAFWNGYLFDRESMRNKEVLNNKSN